MAKTAQMKKTAQIRDIAYVRALIKTAALQAPAPLGMPGLPQLKLPETPKPFAAAPAPAPAPAPATPPAPVQPQPLPRVSPTAPPPTAESLKAPVIPVTPGESAALPPGQASAPPAPKPQTMARPATPPAAAVTPQQMPAAEESADATPASSPAAPAVTRPQETAVAGQPQQPEPLQRQQVNAPETDGRVLNKQLETAAAGWAKKIQEGGPESIPAVAKEAAPLIEQTLDKETLARHSAALSDLKAGKVNTPAIAQLMQEQVGPAGEKFMTDAIARSGAADPSSFGAAASKASEMWNSLGQYGQIGFALGVPLTLIGMFGNSGMASVLGMLGLGVAGGAAAMGGAFGEEPANVMKGIMSSATGGLSNLASGLGIDVPNRAGIEAELTAAAKQGPQQFQAALAKVRERVAPYAGFSADAQKFMAESADKNFGYNQALEYARKNYADLAAQRPYASIWSHIFGKPQMTDDDPNNRNWNEWAWGGGFGSGQRDETIRKRLAELGWEKPACVSVDIALGRKKSARCWEGYEPVPGAKAYSKGSCRPKGSKKTQKEMKNKGSEKKAGCPGGVCPVPQPQPKRPVMRQMPTPPVAKLSDKQFGDVKTEFATNSPHPNSVYAQAIARAKTPDAMSKTLNGYYKARVAGNEVYSPQYRTFHENLTRILQSAQPPASVPR